MGAPVYRVRCWWSLALAALALAGCSSDPSEAAQARMNEALSRAGTATSVARSARAGLPAAFAGLGPHRTRTGGLYAFAGGSPKYQKLGLERTVTIGTEGRYKIDETRWMTHGMLAEEGYDDGRETVFDGARLATRKRWGVWGLRDTDGGAAADALSAAYAGPPQIFAAMSPYVEERDPEPGSPAELYGVPVTWKSLGLKAGGEPERLSPDERDAARRHDRDWTRWLAATHVPHTVTGRVARRADGTVVAFNLRAVGLASVGGAHENFTLDVWSREEAVGGMPAFEVPKGALSQRRERPWLMVREVLGAALSPVYREAETP